MGFFDKIRNVVSRINSNYYTFREYSANIIGDFSGVLTNSYAMGVYGNFGFRNSRDDPWSFRNSVSRIKDNCMNLENIIGTKSRAAEYVPYIVAGGMLLATCIGLYECYK